MYNFFFLSQYSSYTLRTTNNASVVSLLGIKPSSVESVFTNTHQHSFNNLHNVCTNQQPPHCGGAIPDSIWIGSKWLLAFPRVPVTPGTPVHFFAMLPPEQPQKGSTQLLQNRSPVFSCFFSPALLLPVFVSSFFFS